MPGAVGPGFEVNDAVWDGSTVKLPSGTGSAPGTIAHVS
jgi:hypothetical protein